MQAVKAPVRIHSSRRHSLGPCNSFCSVDTDSTTPSVNQDLSYTSASHTAVGVGSVEGPTSSTYSRRNSGGRTFSNCDCQACTELLDARPTRGGLAGTTNNKCSGSGYEILEPHLELLDREEEKIKSKLLFFFLNPIEKYLMSKRIPWKLCLQVLKLFLVTAQLWIFADYRFSHLSYYANQKVSMHHLFIKNWDPAREVQAYPPATGKLAVYTKAELIEFLDFAISSWATIETSSLAPFFRNSSLSLCIEHYSVRNITKDLEFALASPPSDSCISLGIKQAQKHKNIIEWMVENNFSVKWQIMKRIRLQFCLICINLGGSSLHTGPECYKFQVELLFENLVHDGQVTIHLDIKPVRVQCASVTVKSYFYFQFIMIFNLMVIIICLTSLYLCIRSLLRAGMLKMETQYILLRNYGISLTISEKLEFLNLWYVMICVNDSLIIGGSSIKVLLETKYTSEELWDTCSLMLGTGDLLVWVGLFRYLGFFKTYNVIILTMKGAAPNILRFLFCAALIYIGFVFAGWAVLGPYNFKFSSLMSTSECLFSLINGDDMYATFTFLTFQQSPIVWIYSRVYLYSFISLFIYLVLSLFISIIMDTYEYIKVGYSHGFQPSRLEQFYTSGDPKHSPCSFSGESTLGRIISIIRRSWNQY